MSTKSIYKSPAGERAIMDQDVIMTHFKPRIGVLPIFSDEELRRLTMPTLLLIGQEDALRDARKSLNECESSCPS